ncbi:MAG: gliding motility-associated-like protein, partial [Saprospiraceae bacterium]
KEWTIFVANAFTPNDDGNNDVLYIQGGKGTTQVNAFQVFDRWGELIFLAENTPLNDANFGWDGTFKGEPMNSGMFIWSFEVQFEDGRVVTYKGSTFLIR